MSDQIECCPHCGSSRFRTNSLSHVGASTDTKHRCKDCNDPFETPATRELSTVGGARHGLAGKLADPDVSEPGDLSGGEA